jgi:hydroxymethylglutaryl-CoA reductase (NADPH)
MGGNEEEIIGKLERGEVKLYEIDKEVGDSNRAARIRRAFLEKKMGVELKNIGSTSIDFNDATNRNIENPIGAVQVPLGYCGDLNMNGEYAKGSYPVLLATTEGRLVAGISRGMSALNKAGGVVSSVIKDGITRDVLVRVSGIKDASKLMRWIESKEGIDFFGNEFSKNASHGRFIEARPFTTGREVHIRIKATSGAAMGMNMITIASKASVDAMIKHVEERLGIKVAIISESGNMCTDKKPAFINFIEGRGTSVVAEAMVPRQIVADVFKAEPEKMAELNLLKNLTGSALAGSHGFNAHIANALAAMYIAHGQDAAQVVEGAQAITQAFATEEGLYVSVTMPSIEVGTYGGGSKRETQREALSLLGLYGENDTEGRTRLAFAEIVAGVCLAGELNLLAAESTKDLSKSHSQIKRG